MAMTAKDRLRQRAALLAKTSTAEVRPVAEAQQTPDTGVIRLPEEAQDKPRFQTVAQRAENKPASTNPRARGNSGGDSASRVDKAAQSIGMSTVGSLQYLGETVKQANQNTREYMNTVEAEDYAEAVSEFNRVRSQYWEGTPEYQAAYDRVQKARKALEQTSEEVRSQAVDPNSKGSQMMAESQMLREQALEGTEGVGRLLGETAISMGSNLSKLPLGLINPALPAAAMGAEAAAGKAYELQQQGVGAGLALGRGIVSGAIEGVTEKMGIDNLFDLIKSGGKTALKNMLKQAGVEGTEEGFSYAFNWLADKAAKDPNAKFSGQELLESIASGAISGLAFGAGGTVVNRSNVNDRYGAPDVITQTGKDKNVPTKTSLHLADGQVQGLPTKDKETVKHISYYYDSNSDFAKLLVEDPSPSFETVRNMLLNGDLRQSFAEITGEELPAFAEDAYPIVKDALKKADRDPYVFENTKRDDEIRELENKLQEAENRSQTAKGFDFVGARMSVDTYARQLRERRQEYLDARTAQVKQLVDFRNRQLQAAEERKNRSGSFADKVGGTMRADYVTSLLKEAKEKVNAMQETSNAETAWQNTTEHYLKKYAQKKKDAVKISQPAGMPTGESGYKPQPSNKSVAQLEPAVKPQGLPLPRKESLQEAMTASVSGGRTLGDNERKTGLPLPSTVESQLQAIQELTQEQEDASAVANTIRKYVGEDAANWWLEHRNDEGFDAGEVNTRPAPEHSGAVTDEEGNVIGTEAMAKLGVKIEGGIADLTKVQKAREAQWGLDVANRQIAEAEKELHASAAEKRMAENVAKGIDTLGSYQYGWDGKDNRRRSVVEELAALYRLRDTYDKKAVKALGKQNKDAFIDVLNSQILNHLEQATPPGTWSLHTNTWDRNNLRTWGKTIGERLNRLIFDPIKENEASRIRWLNGQIDEMKILGDLTDAENEAVFDMLDKGKETATYDGVRNDVVQKAAEQLRQKYSDYYDAINDVLVAHGYPEIGFIKNYAPHTNDKSIREAMSIFERLGLSDTVTELPTEIAGRTDVFKPGKKWNPHFLHRTGEKTALDAVGGYLSYVNYMSEVLHHVDDIQKVRTFGDQIRYLYGDEGLKADYDAIRADTTMNEQEKEAELEKLRERQTDNSKMGAYVTALDNYANILAGKQTIADRAIEQSDFGRKGLNLLQKPIQILVRSSVPGNLSSAINQTVQLPWLMAEAGEVNVLQAAYDLTRGKLRKENFGAESRFITGKRGAEALDRMKEKTVGEQILDAASVPFEVVDDVTSALIVRAFYNKNIKAGMDHKAAMRKADQQAENLVGSRMKGAKANIFSDKSKKLLTTFQLEVANQWQHLKFDLPQEFREIEQRQGTNAAVSEAAKRILKGTLYTVLLNDLIEQITGNRPAGYDIIGAIRDYIRAGQPEEEDEEQRFDVLAGLGDLGKSLVDDIPFVSNAGAVVGIGDGRLPLPSIDRETIEAGIKKRINAETEEEKKAGWSQIGAGVLKSAATMLPMGNQIKKTIQGGSDVIRGGRYSNDGTQLLYEVEQTPANYARGLLFGRNALPETRAYWDEGGKAALSQKQTGLMKEAEGYGVDQSTYVDFIRQGKKLQGDKDAEGNTIDGSLERKKIALLESMELTDDQKLQLYLDNVASDSRREDVDAMAAAGMTWKQMAPAIDTYLSLNAGELNATQKATELAAWADRNLQQEQAATVKERLEYWQMMQAKASTYEKLTEAGLSSQNAQAVYEIYQTLKPEAGKSTVTDTQKQRAIANDPSLSELVRQKAIRSMLTDKALEKFDRCVQNGVSTKNYVTVKEFYNNTSADKDKNGKSISDSKKKKVWAYIDKLQATPAQKDTLSILCDYDKKLEEAPWNQNKILSLPLPKQEQKPLLTLPITAEGKPIITLP